MKKAKSTTSTPSPGGAFSRREFVAGSAVAGATLFLPGALSAALDGKKTFTILHTNDMHSAFIGLSPASDYTPLTTNDDQTRGGYARTFSLFNRAAMAALLFPMGHISGEVTVAGRTFNQSANGFGDPMIEFNLNVIGPPAQKDIPAAMRYEPGFSVDLLVDLAVPIGEYRLENMTTPNP